MKEWHKQAREMRAAGSALKDIATYFSVSVAAVDYAVNDVGREKAKQRIETQKQNGSRSRIVRRYYLNNKASLDVKKREWARISRSRRRERMLAVAREYGCGDAV